MAKQQTQSTPPATPVAADTPIKKNLPLVLGAAALVAVVGGAATIAVLQSRTPSGSPVSVETPDGTKALSLKPSGDTDITAGGTYLVTGTSTGRLVVDTADEVRLILNGVSITNSQNKAAIKLKGSGKVTLEFQGDNLLTTTGTSDPAAAISSEAELVLTGSGTVQIDASGKAIKAVQSLTVDSGTYLITTAEEGLESTYLYLNGGDLDITARDDGINASDKTDTGLTPVLTITGGRIHINASGDGLDSNGNVVMTGGELYIDGPTSSADSAIDYDGTFTLSGGTIIAVGAAGMAQNVSSTEQPSVLINLGQSASGTLEFGPLSYTPSKTYQSVVLSSPDLQLNKTYDLKISGTTVQTLTLTENLTGTGHTGGPGAMRPDDMKRPEGGFHGRF